MGGVCVGAVRDQQTTASNLFIRLYTPCSASPLQNDANDDVLIIISGRHTQRHNSTIRTSQSTSGLSSRVVFIILVATDQSLCVKASTTINFFSRFGA